MNDFWIWEIDIRDALKITDIIEDFDSSFKDSSKILIYIDPLECIKNSDRVNDIIPQKFEGVFNHYTYEVNRDDSLLAISFYDLDIFLDINKFSIKYKVFDGLYFIFWEGLPPGLLSQNPNLVPKFIRKYVEESMEMHV